jgi:PAS domain S-box-containing protein
MRKPLAKLAWLLPSSLVNRVFLLYGMSLLLFVAGGLAVSLKFQYESEIENTQTASVMLIEVVAQAVQDSAVIGDYDTVRRTLERAVQGSLFRSASFIDLQGGRVEVESRAVHAGAPAWLAQAVESALYDVNRTVSVGGLDYGLLRLRFDTGLVAASFWAMAKSALIVAVLSLSGGLLGIRLLLSHWLGGLDRLRSLLQALGRGTLAVETFDASNEPTEIRRLVDMFNETALLVQERQAMLRALDEQKFALDQHAIVSIADADGNITYANALFCEISGYSLEELIGRNHRIIGSGLMPPEFFRNMWDTISAGQVWRGEICNRKRSGALYWVSATIVPLLDEHGKPRQYIAIRTDLTSQKEAESAILRAKEAAEQANRIKSSFLANMSHEIRTPMNGIIGMTELALDTELSAEQAEYLGMVKGSADALLQIINDILDFSKLEAGRVDIETIECSPEKVMQDLVGEQAIHAHAKRLELLLRIGPSVPDRVIADPGRLRQVVLNLLGNAIKFTHAGEVEVAIERINDPGDTLAALRISVRDTGIGIPDEKRDAIFDAFSQADTSTTRQYGGTGLGLSISAQLVRLMGGRLELDSVPGQGSHFHFTLWLPVVAHTTPLLPSQARLAGLPVLLVDDHAGARQLAAALLHDFGMLPAMAANGIEALVELERAAAAGTPYPCVLLDTDMPGMDGFALASTIAARPGLAGATVMLVAGANRRDHARRCRQAGAGSHLIKPVMRRSLLTALMQALDGMRLAPARRAAPAAAQPSRHPLALLVAEDNPVNQALARRLLEKQGHRVTIATNGVEAVEQWRRGGFDAILMDMDMPQMDGAEATRCIRREEAAGPGRIPIIAMTAHAMQGTREACLAHGMDSYLTKPINLPALWRELEAVGDRRNAMPPVACMGVLDVGRLRSNVDHSQPLYEEMKALLLRDTPAQLNTIRAGIVEGDAEAVRRGAHALHGMVGVFSAQRVQEAALALEQGADQARSGLEIMERELLAATAELMSALEGYRWSAGPGAA